MNLQRKKVKPPLRRKSHLQNQAPLKVSLRLNTSTLDIPDVNDFQVPNPPKAKSSKKKPQSEESKKYAQASLEDQGSEGVVVELPKKKKR